MMYDGKDRGILNEMNKGINYDYVIMCLKNVCIDFFLWIIEFFDDIKIFILKNCLLSDRDVEFLKKMYGILYFNVEYRNMYICNICWFVKYVDIFGFIFGVKMGRSSRLFMIIVYWYKDDGQICIYDDMDFILWFG